jgi:pimeloyl-ACP methyl ester carboxylesterase
MSGGEVPEQIVYVRTEDDFVQAGVIFTPAKEPANPVAIVWIHGWGVNFYSPTYVAIGRALAERGYTCICGNMRMHDLGNVLAWRGDKRIRGGGYWGIASEEPRDVAAWVDCAEKHGCSKVVLVGHSAGWAAVRSYQAKRRDPRVIGVVCASGSVQTGVAPPDAEQLAKAQRFMAAGESEALVRDPKRSFPSYISAATSMDLANESLSARDFFGVHTPNPDVTQLRCPLLAFYGTWGDVGTEADLELLKSCIKRQSTGPSRVDTVMIRKADQHVHGRGD